MPGKFYDAFMNGSIYPEMNSMVRNEKVESKRLLLKEIMHVGSGGKIHRDIKGHNNWNRKGRW